MGCRVAVAAAEHRAVVVPPVYFDLFIFCGVHNLASYQSAIHRHIRVLHNHTARATAEDMTHHPDTVNRHIRLSHASHGDPVGITVAHKALSAAIDVARAGVEQTLGGSVDNGPGDTGTEIVGAELVWRA